MPSFHPPDDRDEGEDIDLCKTGKTELIPALLAAIVPDLAQRVSEAGPFFRSEVLPFSIRRAADPLKGCLNRPVPVEKEPPPPQVVVRARSHRIF